MSQIQNLRRAIDFMVYKKLDEIDLDVVIDYDGVVKFTTSARRITHKESLELKRVFGPLKFAPDYGYAHKDQTGEMKFEDGFKILYHLNSAMTCEKYDPEEMTDEDLSDIMVAIKEGKISVPNCKPSEFKADPAVDKSF